MHDLHSRLREVNIFSFSVFIDKKYVSTQSSPCRLVAISFSIRTD